MDDPWGFMKDYRISHYLQVAVDLQRLDPDRREARLRELAADPKRGSEVIPICRILFEAEDAAGFRRPALGVPQFVAEGDWPLEPIALLDGVPILVAYSYMIAGQPEPPIAYLEYCLENHGWRAMKYETHEQAVLQKIVEQFIAAHPDAKDRAAWLREQAEAARGTLAGEGGR